MGAGVLCGLRHPSPSAPQPAEVGDRNRLPTWRTGSGPARRREHSSLAGSEESEPGAPASGEASRAGSGVQRQEGAFRGRNDSRGEGVPAAPPDSKPQGHRWAWGPGKEGASPTQPSARLLAAGMRVSRRRPSRDSLGLPELPTPPGNVFLREAEFDPSLGPPHSGNPRAVEEGKKNKVVDLQGRPYRSA